MTPSRYSASSINNNSNNINNNNETKKEERRSSSVTRSPMVLKPSHWSKEVKEVTLITARDGVFNFRIVGGSDHGEFPVISEVMPPDTRGRGVHGDIRGHHHHPGCSSGDPGAEGGRLHSS